MLLTIDIGNSNVVLVLYDEQGNRHFDARAETYKSVDEASYRTWMQTHIFNHHLEFDAFIISNVVPLIDAIFFNLMKELSNKPGFRIHVSQFPEFNIDLEHPAELGADLIATRFGALAQFKGPIIIADCGSANKISVLDRDGTFKGGLIMPGIKVSQDALNQFIPHLPSIPLTLPDSIIGQDTVHAMQSGLMYSNISAIEGISKRIEAELKQPCTRLLTGGLSHPIASALPEFIHVPYLLNDGLYHIYHLLKKA